MKIWLDDICPAPDGWVHVKNSAEAIELIETQDVEAISLGDELGAGEPEGYKVIDYIEARIAFRIIMPPNYIGIHTSDPSSYERMSQTLESIRRFKAVLSRCIEEGID